MINNRNNSHTPSRDSGYLHYDVITMLKFPSSHVTGKKFGEELQDRCRVYRAKLSIKIFSQIYHFVKSTSKDENLAKDGTIMG